MAEPLNIASFVIALAVAISAGLLWRAILGESAERNRRLRAVGEQVASLQKATRKTDGDTARLEAQLTDLRNEQEASAVVGRDFVTRHEFETRMTNIDAELREVREHLRGLVEAHSHDKKHLKPSTRGT